MGGFDEYKAESIKRKERTAATEEEPGRNRPEPRPKPVTGDKGKKGSRTDSGKLEAEMKELVIKLGELDALLYKQDHTDTAAQVEQCWEEREALQERLNRLIEIWIEAEEA
ncbi:hypothetical protein D3C75_523190 [compost metagenome]